MKKILVAVFFILILVLFSCTINLPDDTVLSNRSLTETVTIKFSDLDSAITLTPGESISITTPINLEDRKIEYYHPDKRVLVDSSSQKYDFRDRQSYDVKIYNTLSKSAIVTHGGIINDDDPITIPLYETYDKSCDIYTDIPKITVRTADGYPVNYTYLIDNEVMFITLH